MNASISQRIFQKVPIISHVISIQLWQNEEEGSWMREYPITLTQLLLHMYHGHSGSFKPIAMSVDFLSALASALFQQRASTAPSTEHSTPTHTHSGLYLCEDGTLDRSMDNLVGFLFSSVVLYSIHSISCFLGSTLNISVL